MATVSERAKAIVGTRNNKCWNDYCCGGSACPDCEEFKVAIIEQALLAERRLAMESLSEYLRHTGGCLFTFKDDRPCTCGLRDVIRAAAEKEVRK